MCPQNISTTHYTVAGCLSWAGNSSCRLPVCESQAERFWLGNEKTIGIAGRWQSVESPGNISLLVCAVSKPIHQETYSERQAWQSPPIATRSSDGVRTKISAFSALEKLGCLTTLSYDQQGQIGLTPGPFIVLGSNIAMISPPALRMSSTQEICAFCLWPEFLFYEFPKSEPSILYRY